MENGGFKGSLHEGQRARGPRDCTPQGHGIETPLGLYIQPSHPEDLCLPSPDSVSPKISSIAWPLGFSYFPPPGADSIGNKTKGGLIGRITEFRSGSSEMWQGRYMHQFIQRSPVLVRFD